LYIESNQAKRINSSGIAIQPTTDPFAKALPDPVYTDLLSALYNLLESEYKE